MILNLCIVIYLLYAAFETGRVYDSYRDKSSKISVILIFWLIPLSILIDLAIYHFERLKNQTSLGFWFQYVFMRNKLKKEWTISSAKYNHFIYGKNKTLVEYKDSWNIWFIKKTINAIESLITVVDKNTITDDNGTYTDDEQYKEEAS